MSVVRSDPHRAIRNALERIALAAANTDLEEHVAAERAIVEEALAALGVPAEPAPGVEALTTCGDCSFRFGGEERVCPRCDLFAAGRD